MRLAFTPFAGSRRGGFARFLPLCLTYALAVAAFFCACSNPSNSDSKGPSYYAVTLEHGGKEKNLKVSAGNVLTGPQGFEGLSEDTLWCTETDGQVEYKVSRNSMILKPLGKTLAAEADLKKIGVDASHPLNGIYILVQDIDLTGTWTPIGNNTSPFTGKFFGAGHRIRNLVLPHNKQDIGLFGFISGAVIQDLFIELGDNTITNTVTSPIYAGAAAGYARNSTFTNIRVKNGLTVSAVNLVYAGGIAGYNAGSTIENCSATGVISVSSSSSYTVYAGGIAGVNGSASSNSTIANCYATGAINASCSSYGAYAGDIVGYNSSSSASSTIENCYAAGAINASSYNAYAGGIAGYNYSLNTSSSNTIENCAALMDSITVNDGTSIHRVTGSNIGTGGGIFILANNNIALDTMKLNGTAVTGTGALDGPNGKSTTEAGLQAKETYSTLLGWDFDPDGDWKWDGANNRPVLSWES